MLRKPLHNIHSRNIFPFSMEGCVLYLPLWQEDMQGSTLISYDPNHESCSVNGAAYSLNVGRTFDGTDDNIILPANWMPATGTIEIWAKYNREASMYLFSSDLNEISIYNDGSNDILLYYDGAPRLNETVDSWTNNTFVHQVFTYARNTTGYLYINGTELDDGAIPDTAVTNVATRLGEGTNGSNDFTGTMGEVRIYNRVLSAGEILHNYEVTKERYL